MQNCSKGSCEPKTRTNGINCNAMTTDGTSKVSNNDVATTGEETPVRFKPDWDTINKGVFLPPELIMFAKQLHFMHDWFDEYGLLGKCFWKYTCHF